MAEHITACQLSGTCLCRTVTGRREVDLRVSVGSTTGAPRLYGKARMRVAESDALYRKATHAHHTGTNNVTNCGRPTDKSLWKRLLRAAIATTNTRS